MSLLNTLNLKFPYRQKSKTDETIERLVNEIDQIILLSNKIVNEDLALSKESKRTVRLSFEAELKDRNERISILRKNILSSKMLISQNQCSYPYYNAEEKKIVVDTHSVVGMSPRINVEELKSVADKIGFCIFDESVFSEENEAENKEIAASSARYLKENGYRIYYLSPLSAFDYKAFIENGNAVYSTPSFWGQHLQTFNTLALSLNIFRDLYSMIDVLKKENKEIKKAIESDRTRVDAFHQQFKQYVSHVYSNLKLLEAPLKKYIDKENKQIKSAFESARSNAIVNNKKYKNNPFEKVTYYKIFDKKTNKQIEVTDYIDMFSDFEDEYYVRGSYLVNKLMPVPEKPSLYKDFYAKMFNVSDLDDSKKIKEFEANYTVPNVKKLIQSELGNNYLMIAIKGNIMNPEQEDGIVLSSWGSGVSEETMIATGVKNDQ